MIQNERAEELLKELLERDEPRESELKLLAATLAENERLNRSLKTKLEQAHRVRRAFPNCCRVPFGFDATSCPEMGTHTSVSFQAQEPLRICRLVIDPECASHFMISDFKIGMGSQLHTAPAVPASMFPPIPSSDPAEMKRVHDAFLAWNISDVLPGQQVVLVVQNLDAKRQIFRAALWGEVVSYEDCKPVFQGY